jgi:hypothetical protein
MTTRTDRLIRRVTSLALAAVATLAMMASIHSLARTGQGADPLLAQQAAAARA